jgi:hypothetical protein
MDSGEEHEAEEQELPDSAEDPNDPNELDIYGRRILESNGGENKAETLTTFKAKKEYFASYINDEDFNKYFRFRQVPGTILDQGSDSPNQVWITIIIMTIILLVVCFLQNCGHLINQNLVLGKRICTGGPTTTLLRKSLIALALITCFFFGIYLMLNINHDYNHGRENTLKDIEKALTDGVIQTNIGSNLTWSNDVF